MADTTTVKVQTSTRDLLEIGLPGDKALTRLFWPPWQRCVAMNVGRSLRRRRGRSKMTPPIWKRSGRSNGTGLRYMKW